MSFAVRIKHAKGQSSINVQPDQTLSDLKKIIFEHTSIPIENQIIKSGFPPKEIIATNESKLSEMGIKKGETLVIDAPVGTQKMASTLTVIKRKVDEDNSCLFSSIAYLFKNDRKLAPSMRQTIIDFLKKRPEKYDDSVLGQPLEKYCEWISNPITWGGEIEVSIFSELFQTEIDIVDIQTLRIFKYGEENQTRALLLYNGIHYDPLVLTHSEKALESDDIKTHPVSMDVAIEKALALAHQLNANNEFTNLGNFRLQCTECHEVVFGEREAQEHMAKTRHTSFREDKKTKFS